MRSHDLPAALIESTGTKDQCISEMGVLGFADWMLSSGDGTAERPLRLPSVQRTALWDAGRIINLWDSLMRGLPIGMFYLVSSISGGYSRSLPGSDGGPGPTIPSSGTGYELLDGQQRALAILLGKQAPSCKNARCMWVDLGRSDPNLTICLRLTSQSQPFGYDGQGKKLDTGQRRNARKTFDGDEGREIAKRTQDDESCNTGKETQSHELYDAMIAEGHRPPKPFQSKAAVPLHELLSAWNGSKGDEDVFRSAVIGLLDGSAELMTQFSELVTAFRNLDKGRIGLLLVRRPESADSDWLLRLFERIGAGGVPLTEAERLYSIYKHHEPFIHDVVTEIESQIGRLMPPVDVAGTALRIANARTPAGGFGTPGVAALAKEMREKGDFARELHKLIPSELTTDPAARPEDRAKCLLAVAFKTLFDVLRYDEHNKSGLPAAMLVELPRDLLQVLAYWVVLTGLSDVQRSPPFSGVRAEMLRFVLFWRLCTSNDSQAGIQCFKFLTKAKQPSAFPGRELYQLLTGTQASEDESREQLKYAIELVPPDDLEQYAPFSNTERWLDWNERFERDSGNPASRELYKEWWNKGWKTLIWIQRDYITNGFRSYDPTSGRDDDKPFELDHLQPYAFFNHPRMEPGAYNNFLKNRYALRDGIGNFRWFCASENSRWGNCNVVEKLNLDRQREPDPWHPSGFKNEDPATVQLWRDAFVNGNQWNGSNMKAFQQAVEERTLWLYQQFWKDADFDFWFSKPTLSSPHRVVRAKC